MRGAALERLKVRLPQTISTHAPHARRGASGLAFYSSTESISTHAPHARRGYSQLPSLSADWINFYSRASCEARLDYSLRLRVDPAFLLTRLMRGAARHTPGLRRGRIFLLTRLMRGAAI